MSDILKNNEITILAFNHGTAGKFVNGPGICLSTFIKYLNRQNPKLKINLFTALPSERSQHPSLIEKAISRSDIVHYWSGINSVFKNAIKLANKLNKIVILGPNLIDCVELEKEKSFISDIHFNLLLTVNKRLEFKISKEHNIPIEIVKTFLVGPDLDLWRPVENKKNFILWKGNSKHFVKDVDFAFSLQKALPQYEFKFLGYPKPYQYEKHIEQAKQAKIYISTSLSETMGVCIIEQMAAGIPTVTHPEIYFQNENYNTGIVSNKTIESYTKCITELMEDSCLYNYISANGIQKVDKIFSKEAVVTNYFNTVRTILE